MTTPENPPAFPLPLGSADLPEPNNGCAGMTLHDYFVAHCPITLTEFMSGYKNLPDSTDGLLVAYAVFRWKYADAMLAARSMV